MNDKIIKQKENGGVLEEFRGGKDSLYFALCNKMIPIVEKLLSTVGIDITRSYPGSLPPSSFFFYLFFIISHIKYFNFTY